MPAPVLMGYVVTYAELAGGIPVILGLLTRLAALVLTIDLVAAIVLVKVNVGLIGKVGAALGDTGSIEPAKGPVPVRDP